MEIIDGKQYNLHVDTFIYTEQLSPKSNTNDNLSNSSTGDNLEIEEGIRADEIRGPIRRKARHETKEERKTVERKKWGAVNSLSNTRRETF